MICLELQEALAGVLAGALAEPARAAAQAHLAACPACRAAEATARASWDFLAGLEPPPVPLDLERRLGTAMPAETAPPVAEPMAPARVPWRALLAASAVAATVVGGVAWRPWADRPEPPAPAVPAKPPAPSPPVPWGNPTDAVMQLVAVPRARVWASAGSRGGIASGPGRLVLEDGVIWGRPLEGEKLSLEACGWRMTVTRGTFTLSVRGAGVCITCHEGFVRLEHNTDRPDWVGPAAVPEGTCFLLLPGRPPVGPRAARAPYAGEPGGAPPAEDWWRRLGEPE